MRQLTGHHMLAAFLLFSGCRTDNEAVLSNKTLCRALMSSSKKSLGLVGGEVVENRPPSATILSAEEAKFEAAQPEKILFENALQNI